MTAIRVQIDYGNASPVLLLIEEYPLRNSELAELPLRQPSHWRQTRRFLNWMARGPAAAAGQ